MAAEKARLAKELEKIESEITKAEQKLSNPNFTSKAPPHVLQEHQQRLAEWQAKRDRVKKGAGGVAGLKTDRCCDRSCLCFLPKTGIFNAQL